MLHTTPKYALSSLPVKHFFRVYADREVFWAIIRKMTAGITARKPLSPLCISPDLEEKTGDIFIPHPLTDHRHRPGNQMVSLAQCTIIGSA